MAASTIVHIVGIALMSTQLSPDHHLQTLMPKMPNINAPKVEQHVAFIAFETKDLLRDKGRDWTPRTFPKVAGMQYVVLNEDRVTITVEGANGHDAFASSSLDLPSLSSCCPDADIDKRFAPPLKGMPKDNLDAAIIDFPKAYEAHGCNATGAVNGRGDTLVTLQKGEAVRLSAGPKKWIRLRAGAYVYIANAPKTYIDPTSTPMNITMQHDDATAHYNAYYGMVTVKNCKSWSACASAPSQQCNAAFVTHGAKTPPDVHWSIIDINCSDSQYP